MKKNKYTIALVGTLFLFGATAAAGDCKGPDKVNLMVKKYHLSLNENMPICAPAGGEIMIRIINPNGSGHVVMAGDVTAERKASSDPNVDVGGSNSDDKDYLKIEIAENAAENQEYKFWIDVKDVGRLDPRIRVVPSSAMLALFQQSVDEKISELEAIANSYGATVYDALELARNYKAE